MGVRSVAWASFGAAFAHAALPPFPSPLVKPPLVAVDDSPRWEASFVLTQAVVLVSIAASPPIREGSCVCFAADFADGWRVLSVSLALLVAPGEVLGLPSLLPLVAIASDGLACCLVGLESIATTSS